MIDCIGGLWFFQTNCLVVLPHLSPDLYHLLNVLNFEKFSFDNSGQCTLYYYLLFIFKLEN